LTEKVFAKLIKNILYYSNDVELDIVSRTELLIPIIHLNEFKQDGILVDSITDKEAVLFRNNNLDFIVSSFINDFQKDNNTVLTAWRNNTISMYNKLIREKIYGEKAKTESYLIGEKIIFKKPLVSNEETIVANNVKGVILNKKSILIENKYNATELEIEITKINTNGTYTQEKITTYVLNIYNLNSLKQDAEIERSENNINLSNILNKVNLIDYAYAITVHKIQGSTVNNIHIIESDILNNQNSLEMLQLLRTATSRPRKKIVYYTDKTNNLDSIDINLSSDILSYHGDDSEIFNFEYIFTSDEQKLILKNFSLKYDRNIIESKQLLEEALSKNFTEVEILLRNCYI